MDLEKDRLKKVLTKSGYFLTKPRHRLFRILQDHNAMTTKEIIVKMSRYDQATVYRCLNLFEDLGIIKRLQMGWNTRFELTDTFHHHHHHLNCLKCGRIISLPEDFVLEGEIARLSYKHKFKAIDHQLEIRGLCTTCQ